ncbi:MAG TPA: class I SAM-dependent methyltransferase [Vicinamibacterales bacterium]
MTTTRGYRGVGMEGPIATWYAKNTGRDLTRFRRMAATIAALAPADSRILEVAPGPGYGAIELARAGAYRVTGLDISESFVRIARENARAAGVEVDFRHGNASAMPFPEASFDVIVCTAAFKNFTDPVGALNECERVLAPGGRALIYDLRKDASLEEIAAEVRGMDLSPFNAWMTNWTFRTVLLRRAYTRDVLETMVTRSRFGRGEIRLDGIAFELRLSKPSAVGTFLRSAASA